MKPTFLLALVCVPQTYIDSLDTRHYYNYWLKEKNEKKVEKYLQELHRFRATNYGRVEAEPATHPYNKESVTKFQTETTFMGLKVKLHQKIIHPLKCVEQEIHNNCYGKYVPRTVSGYRSNSSYKRVISNHQFGLAIDFDPLNDHTHNDGNPCCGLSCETQWRTHPICNSHDTAEDSPYNVSLVNECWVKSFEKFGFHWLINFRMHDTMHFEYLADPS